MNFVKLFGNKIRAKDVVFKNEKTLMIQKVGKTLKDMLVVSLQLLSIYQNMMNFY